jgi:phage N-6-adenine-methyltransferase
MSAPGTIQKAENSKANWRTPPELFKFLDKLYGFELDAAADKANSLCAEFYDEEHNALWQTPEDRVIWCNPPYGKLAPWIELFAIWGEVNTVVALVPAAPDTVWWKMGADHAFETILLSPGRIQFIDPETGKPATNNPTASTLFIFTPYTRRLGIRTWDWRRDVFD